MRCNAPDRRLFWQKRGKNRSEFSADQSQVAGHQLCTQITTGSPSHSNVEPSSSTDSGVSDRTRIGIGRANEAIGAGSSESIIRGMVMWPR